MTPDFLIVGTGRSGTTWVAETLTAAGVSCGHEDWWGPTGPGSGTQPHVDFDGDSSLYAVPYLDKFDGPVALQTRHPLGCIASMLAWRLFDSPHQHHPPPAADFFEKHWTATIDPLIACCDYWVDCNEIAGERADVVWQAETVTAETLCRFVSDAGAPPSNGIDVKGIAPHRYWAGHKGGNYAPVELHWRDLPPVRFDRVRDLADELGYR
jgi:hypothetical protein